MHKFGSQLVNDLQHVFLNDVHSQKYRKLYKDPAPPVSWKNPLISSNLGLPFASLVLVYDTVMWLTEVPRDCGVLDWQ